MPKYIWVGDVEIVGSFDLTLDGVVPYSVSWFFKFYLLLDQKKKTKGKSQGKLIAWVLKFNFHHD